LATISAIIRGDLRRQLVAAARQITRGAKRGLVKATAGARNDIRRAIRGGRG
jgi:hypothetical protein